MKKYSLASDTWGDEEIKAIHEVISTGNYTMGEKVSVFEDEFSRFIGSKHAIMVNSGSSANLIAIEALKYSNKLPQKGEIIVPAVSWSTTFYPLHQAGYKLVFVDIDKESLNISISEVKKAINKNTIAVMGVSLLGNPYGMDILKKICDDNNIIFIEDNCESFGAKINSRFSGTFGKVGSFSFFFSHHLQTMEGGMIVTDDREVASVARSLRAHGWSRDKKSGDLSSPDMSNFSKSFEFIYPGYCVRPIEFMGAIGSAQLKKWEAMRSFRVSNANLFIKMIEKHKKYFSYQSLYSENSTWFGFALILINETADMRSNFLEILDKFNIEYRPIVAGDFTNQKVMSYLKHRIFGDLKESKNIDKNGLFVGNDSKDLSQEINMLDNAINYFKNAYFK